jgi:outer membrane protein assembly factor BamE (lipoprotein component of BamABCDE complex)
MRPTRSTSRGLARATVSRRDPASTGPRVRKLLLATLLAACAAAGCVTQDTRTGELIPRGKQRYEFSKVTEAAEDLKDGMTRSQVLLLLGSPAEMDEAGSVWVYLPERYGILVPARALQLRFDGSVLVEHGYRAIVLGAQL